MFRSIRSRHTKEDQRGLSPQRKPLAASGGASGFLRSLSRAAPRRSAERPRALDLLAGAPAGVGAAPPKGDGDEEKKTRETREESVKETALGGLGRAYFLLAWLEQLPIRGSIVAHI